MQFEIAKRPSYAVLEVELAVGEAIGATPGALLARSRHVDMEASVRGDDGIGGMIKRAVSDERSFVENSFTARRDGATVTLVPDHPGDITAVDVTEAGPLCVQSGASLAWEPTVGFSTEVDAAGNFFSSGALTVLGLSGQGWAFLSSFGSICERQVTREDPLIADEDHVVAWTGGLEVSRERVGGIKTNVLGGEGTVTTFSGDGQVWLQTHNPVLFGSTGGDGDGSADTRGGVDPGGFQ
jgi:uncharacterized protein (TIGR00266 family)